MTRTRLRVRSAREDEVASCPPAPAPMLLPRSLTAATSVAGGVARATGIWGVAGEGVELVSMAVADGVASPSATAAGRAVVVAGSVAGTVGDGPGRVPVGLAAARVTAVVAGVTVPVRDGDGVGLAVGDGRGVAEPVARPVGVGVTLGLAVGVGVALGLVVGVSVALGVAVAVEEAVGVGVWVGGVWPGPGETVSETVLPPLAETSSSR